MKKKQRKMLLSSALTALMACVFAIPFAMNGAKAKADEPTEKTSYAFLATATTLADGLSFGVDTNAGEGLNGYKLQGTLTGAEAGKKAEVNLGKVDAKSGYSVLLDPNMDYTMRSVTSYVAGPKRFNINTKGDSGVSHTFCMMHAANKENGRVRINGSGLNVTDIVRTSYQHI